MITFFKTPQLSIIATESKKTLTRAEVEKLCWLYGEANTEKEENLQGYFIGNHAEHGHRRHFENRGILPRKGREC